MTVDILGRGMRLCITSYACVVFWDAILKVPMLLLCKGLHMYLCVTVSAHGS